MKYKFRNTETEEVIEVDMKMSEYDQWKEENPEWERYYAPTDAPQFTYSGTRDVISRTPDGFKDILNAVKKGSGRDATIKTK